MARRRRRRGRGRRGSEIKVKSFKNQDKSCGNDEVPEVQLEKGDQSIILSIPEDADGVSTVAESLPPPEKVVGRNVSRMRVSESCSVASSSGSGDRSGIYIPPHLRNRKFGVATVDIPLPEVLKVEESREDLGRMHGSEKSSELPGWSIWQTPDFLSDFLKSLKCEDPCEESGKQPIWVLLQQQPNQTFWSTPPEPMLPSPQLESVDWPLWKSPLERSKSQTVFPQENLEVVEWLTSSQPQWNWWNRDMGEGDDGHSWRSEETAQPLPASTPEKAESWRSSGNSSRGKRRWGWSFSEENNENQVWRRDSAAGPTGKHLRSLSEGQQDQHDKECLTSTSEGPISPRVASSEPEVQSHFPKKPQITVTSWKPMNFTNVNIQFTVTVTNLSKQYTLQISKAVAITPSGSERITCNTRNGQDKNTFYGNFIATSEVGNYTVKVKVRLSMKKVTTTDKGKRNVVIDTRFITTDTNIMVSRNYYRESWSKPKFAFKLDFGEENFFQGGLGNGDAWGLACDKQTNKIYYTEGSGNYISCIDPTTSGNKLIFRAKEGECGGILGTPLGICCDERHRRLIVCERDSHKVSFFAMNNGEYIGSFGTPGEQEGMFKFPWDVAVSPNGNLIVVTDSENNRIQLFDRYGAYLGQQPLPNPRGVCFGMGDFHLQIYATSNDGSLVEAPPDLQSSRNIVIPIEGKQLRRPQGLDADKTGGLLVTDAKNRCIYHFNPMSERVPLLSTIYTLGDKGFKNPVNLTIMKDGHVAVLEDNGSVYIF